MDKLILYTMAGFALYVLWTVARPKWQFKIVARSQAVEFIHGVPNSKRQSYEHFFLNDVRIREIVTVRGRRERNGRLVLSITGTDDHATQQRIRNFFMHAS